MDFGSKEAIVHGVDHVHDVESRVTSAATITGASTIKATITSTNPHDIFPSHAMDRAPRDPG